MSGIKKFFIDIFSFFSFFYLGHTLSYLSILIIDYFFKIISDVWGAFELCILISHIFSFIFGIFGMAISLGRFNSENWRFNRYWLLFGLPLLLFIFLYAKESFSPLTY